MTQTLTQPTTDPRFACPPPCPECVEFPGHQDEAYAMGYDYGLNRYHPVSFDRELAHFDRQIAEADRLAKAFVCGIYDGLIKQAEAVTA